MKFDLIVEHVNCPFYDKAYGIPINHDVLANSTRVVVFCYKWFHNKKN